MEGERSGGYRERGNDFGRRGSEKFARKKNLLGRKICQDCDSV